MTTKTRLWTRADLERFPYDGNRYEILDGALLMTPLPSYDHQEIAGRLVAQLLAYCAAHGLATLVAPGAVPHLRSELQPHIQIVPGVRRRHGARGKDVPRPILIVEVLTPDTRPHHVIKKRAAYLRWGIVECWIVDPVGRQITVVRPDRDDERVTKEDVLQWQPHPEVPALEIPLGEIFR